ncbi:MAG: sigma-70 family RNA polymerase sigma factor [Cyclobacteriaceae bacterium]
MRTSDRIIDEWLVINCQQGDRKALELLVKRWDSRILKRAYITTQDYSASKDIAQDAWITIIKKLRSLKDPGAFEWWSLRIATTKSIDWIRANQLSRKRDETRRMAQEDFMETQAAPAEEIIVSLRAAIQELPEGQQQVVRMFYQENLNILNIARILDLPTGTVKSRLFQARERLKKILRNKTIES